jgi:hypothetical protein
MSTHCSQGLQVYGFLGSISEDCQHQGAFWLPTSVHSQTSDKIQLVYSLNGNLRNTSQGLLNMQLGFFPSSMAPKVSKASPSSICKFQNY